MIIIRSTWKLHNCRVDVSCHNPSRDTRFTLMLLSKLSLDTTFTTHTHTLIAWDTSVVASDQCVCVYQYFSDVSGCVCVCTARSRKDETRNGHGREHRNSEWSSHDSFQMAPYVRIRICMCICTICMCICAFVWSLDFSRGVLNDHRRTLFKWLLRNKNCQIRFVCAFVHLCGLRNEIGILTDHHRSLFKWPLWKETLTSQGSDLCVHLCICVVFGMKSQSWLFK